MENLDVSTWCTDDFTLDNILSNSISPSFIYPLLESYRETLDHSLVSLLHNHTSQWMSVSTQLSNMDPSIHWLFTFYTSLYSQLKTINSLQVLIY